VEFVVQGPLLGQAVLCEPILRSLPQWFGIEEAVVHYVQEIEHLPTFLAVADGRVAGFLSLKEHFAEAAEVYVMGLRVEYHRRGLGCALVERAEEWFRSRGGEYLQVKTLSPARADENYARTRAFYRAMGFRPLEEFPHLWDEANPCLLLVKALR
jgi:ribosomal protein S18 acetylase RimI-like enzyme